MDDIIVGCAKLDELSSCASQSNIDCGANTPCGTYNSCGDDCSCGQDS